MTQQNTHARTIQCPQCGKAAEWSSRNPHRPFCSERCRLIDLGAWANEDYQIPTTASEDDYSTGLDSEELQFTPIRH